MISEKVDYLGVNYYERHITRADPNDRKRGALSTYPGEKRTAVGIGINPEGLLDVLLRLNAEYTRLPIYVTETGIALHDFVDPIGAVRDRNASTSMWVICGQCEKLLRRASISVASLRGRCSILSNG